MEIIINAMETSYEKSMNNVIIIIRVFTYIFTAKGEYIYDRFKLRINGAKNES